KFEDIPQQYIDSVKRMWVQVLGESHSAGYRNGITDLAEGYPRYAGFGQEFGVLEGPEAGHLRLNRYWWSYDPNTGNYDHNLWYRFGAGEEDFWTTQWAVDNVKENITYCNDSANNPVTAVGFGWCWDMIMGTGGNPDPVYGCRWAGRRNYWNGNGFTNANVWGIDDEDNVLIDPDGDDTTLVNLMTYIRAIEEIDSHDPRTICFFTTGPVDISGDGSQAELEYAYQRYLKHEYIRNYVKTNGGVLFDYGDILTYNDAGEQATESWQGKVYPVIHPDNDGEYKNSHIDSIGSIRLAKAMWWMLARVAGWEGDTILKYKTNIFVSICDGESHLTGGGLQTISGMYYDTLTASNNLDSIIITHLTVNNRYDIENFDTIAKGDSCFAGGKYQYTSGVYIDSLRSVFGCDSIVITDLFVNEECKVRTFTIDTTLCKDSSIIINGKEYSIPGIYYDTISYSNHCDSILTIVIEPIDCITTNEMMHTDILKIYPNPTKGIINLPFKDFKNFQRIEVYNNKGILVFSECSFEKNEIDIRHLDAGIYFLYIYSDKSVIIKKALLLKNN
ncbi:MAG: T9SS type A sorting domain-containing protein, partial [Bacteroidales bacterium]|nr:T9SS type A sorting domain-containing protein [Bacteroidales bacterium]